MLYNIYIYIYIYDSFIILGLSPWQIRLPHNHPHPATATAPHWVDTDFAPVCNKSHTLPTNSKRRWNWGSECFMWLLALNPKP